MPPPAPGQPGGVPYAGGPPRSETNGLAIASLICGILGLVGFWACFVGAALGLVAVVLGIFALRSAKDSGQGRGLAIGGLVTGGLALLAGTIVSLVIFVFADDVSTNLDDINSDPSDGECDFDRFMQDPDC